jgi:uncharacterized membrane protein
MKQLAPLLFLLLLMPLAIAELDFDQGLTAEEESQVDEILAPVMKVYNIIKYAATIIGVLVLVFAGVSFLTAGGDTGKKDKAKHMMIGVIVGLIVIWVAPLIVRLIFA